MHIACNILHVIRHHAELGHLPNRQVWQTFFSWAHDWHTSVLLYLILAPGHQRNTVKGRAQIWIQHWIHINLHCSQHLGYPQLITNPHLTLVTIVVLELHRKNQGCFCSNYCPPTPCKNHRFSYHPYVGIISQACLTQYGKLLYTCINKRTVWMIILVLIQAWNYGQTYIE